MRKSEGGRTAAWNLEQSCSGKENFVKGTVKYDSEFQQRSLRFMEREKINLIAVSVIKTWALLRGHHDTLSLSAQRALVVVLLLH